MKKIKLNKRDTVVLVAIACAIIFLFAKYVVYEKIQDYKFANQMETIYNRNENAVFSIDKIVLYSSANAVDNSEGQTMQDLNIYQFTDMAIYIDNTSYINDLTEENTVKEMYIDNIKINAATSKGDKTLTYKNPLGFGKFKFANQNNNNNEQQDNKNEGMQENSSNENTNSTNTENINNENKEENSETTTYENENEQNQEEQPERIDFNIIYTNEDNDRSDYITPTFYTDCSNPITLNYTNKNIVTNYAVSTQDTQIKFDGSILQSVGVNLEDIACTVDFDIHIKNNLNQDFVCSVGIKIPLTSENRSIYNGYMYSMDNQLQKVYAFFKK